MVLERNVSFLKLDREEFGCSSKIIPLLKFNQILLYFISLETIRTQTQSRKKKHFILLCLRVAYIFLKL